MADNKWETVGTIEQPQDDSQEWETVGSVEEESGVLDTVADTIVGASDTGLGHLAAGVSSAAASISPIDKLLTYLARTPEQQAMEEQAMAQFAAADDKPLREITPEETLGEAYDRGQANLKSSISEARERSPIAAGASSIAANIGEGLLGAKALGTAVKGSKAAQAYDKAGKLGKSATMAGLGSVEGATVAGLKDEDVLEGAAFGTLVGAGELLQSARNTQKAVSDVLIKEGKDIGSKGAGATFGEEVSRLLKLGEDKVNVFSKDFKDATIKKLQNMSEDSVNTIINERKKLGKEIGDIRAKYNNSDVVDISDVLHNMRKAVDEITTTSSKGSRAQSKDILKEHLDDIEDIVRVEDLNNVSSEIFDLVTDFSRASRITDPSIQKMARDFSRKVSKDLDNIVKSKMNDIDAEALDEAKRNYSKLSDLETLIGARSKKGKVDFTRLGIDKKIDKLAADLVSEGSTRKALANNRLFDELENAGLPKEQIESIKTQADQLALDLDIYDSINPNNQKEFTTRLKRVLYALPVFKYGQYKGATKRNIIDPTKARIKEMKNLIGKVKTKAINKTAPAVTKVSEKIRNASPDKLVQIADSLPTQLGNQLKKIAEQPDDVKRAAYIHALTQQPAFRQYFKEEDDE